MVREAGALSKKFDAHVEQEHLIQGVSFVYLQQRNVLLKCRNISFRLLKWAGVLNINVLFFLMCFGAHVRTVLLATHN